MKLKLPRLTKTQKIFAAFAIIVVISFLVWGCKSSTKTEVKTDSTEMKIDSVKAIDTLK
jgi:hypothetical protein